jgi:DNA-directed RNA polymerase subunit L
LAKKKAESKDENLDTDEKDVLDDEKIESHYPDVSNDSKSKEESVSIDVVDDEDEEEIEEGFEIEPEPEPTYKFLTLGLKKGFRDDDYTLSVEGQSHGFCNIFVQLLLETEGVNSAAYKITKLVPPEIFIRLEDGYEIKKILYNAIETLRTEVGKVEKVFKKLM